MQQAQRANICSAGARQPCLASVGGLAPKLGPEEVLRASDPSPLPATPAVPSKQDTWVAEKYMSREVVEDYDSGLEYAEVGGPFEPSLSLALTPSPQVQRASSASALRPDPAPRPLCLSGGGAGARPCPWRGRSAVWRAGGAALHSCGPACRPACAQAEAVIGVRVRGDARTYRVRCAPRSLPALPPAS